MAKRAAAGSVKKTLNHTNGKGTSIGNGLTKTKTMNKSKRRSFKKYRGQGK